MKKAEGTDLSQSAQKILTGRRIAIPKEMFEKSKLYDGGIVLIEQDERGRITIIPAEVKARKPA